MKLRCRFGFHHYAPVPSPFLFPTTGKPGFWKCKHCGRWRGQDYRGIVTRKADVWPKTRARCIGVIAFWSILEIGWFWRLFFDPYEDQWWWTVIIVIAIPIGLSGIYNAVQSYKQLSKGKS